MSTSIVCRWLVVNGGAQEAVGTQSLYLCAAGDNGMTRTRIKLLSRLLATVEVERVTIKGTTMADKEQRK